MDSPEQKFFVSDDGKEKLSITKAELQAGIDSGKYGEKTLAWTKGMSGWLPLSDPSWESHGILIEPEPPDLPPSISNLQGEPTKPSIPSTTEKAIFSSAPQAKQPQSYTAPKQLAKSGSSKVLIGTLGLGLAVLCLGGLAYWFFANEQNLADPETLDEILAEAMVAGKIQFRGKEGEQLAYAPNTQTPYTGWTKAMHLNGQVKELTRVEDGWMSEQIQWHENGQKLSHSRFKKGKREGPYIDWHDNGQEKRKVVFENDKMKGKITHWHKNGQKRKEGQYINGTASGNWTSWFENGQKEEEWTYAANVNPDGFKMMRVGVSTKWHENGNKKSVTTWRNGNGWGPYKKWHENGNLMEEGNLTGQGIEAGLGIAHGLKREGLWKFFDDKGKLEKTEYWKDGEKLTFKVSVEDGHKTEWYENKEGKQEGPSTIWHPNGQKLAEGNYKEWKEDGLWTYWHENGQKKEEGNWKDGRMDGPWTAWHENGQKLAEGNYKDGKEDGLWTYWHENGQKKEEGNYKNGRMDGPWTAWYENGQKEGELNYKDGKADGPAAIWHENGQKRTVGNYKDGMKDGPGAIWYESGQKEGEGNWKDGKFMSAKVWKPNGEKCPVSNVKDGNGILVSYNEDGTEDFRATFKDGERVED